jgi:PQQ-dependent dehydrogenase (s-GDH family)
MTSARFPASAVMAATWLASLVAQNPRNIHNLGPESFSSRVVVSGLANPWEVTWGPDDRLWITERTAFRVVRVNPADGSTRIALTLDEGYQSSVQEGLMGLALHPDLLKGKGADFVYVAYTYDADPGPALDLRIRIRRYTYDRAAESLRAPLDVLANMPAHDDHGGARLLVGPDGRLYFTRGDQGSNWLANFCTPIRSQDLPTSAMVRARDWSAYQGKILRINPDGSIPDDNPALNGVRSHIYAYGFRNPQGLVFGLGGILYASEHGPSTDDELDAVTAGGNYGWPHVAGYKDDRSYAYANWSASSPTPCRDLRFDNLNPPSSVPQQKESAWQHAAFVPPMATMFTVPPGYDLAALGSATIAPAGIDIYHWPAIPGWNQSILMTGMRTGAVYRFKLGPEGRTVDGQPVEYFKADDRYRDLAISPDGRRIFLATDSFGATADAKGQRTDKLAHPGAIVEFTYQGGPR